MDFGKALDNALVKKGLTELNPEINFDPISRLPSQWRPMMVNDGKPLYQSETEGVYWGVQFIAALDRGMIPEGELYEWQEAVEEVAMQDLDRYDGTSVIFYEILPSESGYHQALLLADQKQDNFYQDDRGKVFKRQCIRLCSDPACTRQVHQGRMIRNGWRNTFNAIIAAKIPGATRQAIEKKFGVDLTPKPVPVEAVVSL